MFWLGKLGALAALPTPRPGLTPTSVRAGTVAQTIGGGQVASFASPTGRRVYQMAWNHLPPESYTMLEEFFTGARGRGPFILLDPARRNLLSANQSGTTSATSDTSGFTVDPSEAVTSTSDTYSRGPQSLRWTLPGVVTSGVLDLDPPGRLAGWPTPPGQSWTLSGLLNLAGVAASVTVTPTLSWRRIDGSEVSASTGVPVAVAPGGWAAFSVSGAAPGGAVAFRAQLRAPVGVLATAGIGTDVTDLSPSARPRLATRWASGGPGQPLVAALAAPPRLPGTALIERPGVSSTDVLVDQLQLEMNPAAQTWVVGTGVPLVSMTALSPVYDQFIPYASMTATFVEVG